MKTITSFLIALFFFSASFGQQITQVVRGRLFDIETQSPLPGGKVIIFKDSTMIGGSITDSLGRFRITGIPIGRYRIVASYLGYSPAVMNEVAINSGKEVILEIGLEETVTMLKAVELTATSKDQVLNDMASVSARTFSIEDTDRYAGSRGDPARMVANFAGVRGSDDSRNDIVVRGNSPLGIQYRVDGLDIPSPNHFTLFGSAGGPVSILNNKTLSNSDFFTSAFPAEYGNALSGVFDLKMKKGNNETHEFTGQFGILGAELTAEGPISRKNRSSYLATYRYSTFSILKGLGITLGSSAVPKYQDMAFKLNFPTKKGNSFSVFGLGGTSKINILDSERDSTDIYDDDLGKNVDFGSQMGAAGFNYLHLIGSSTFIKAGVAASIVSTSSDQDTLLTDSLAGIFNEPGAWQRLRYTKTNINTHIRLNHKFNSRHSLRAGLMLDQSFMNAYDSVYDKTSSSYEQRADIQESTLLARTYLQWKYNLSAKLTLNTGLYAQHFFLNNSFSLEPRVGLRWQAGQKHTLSAGYGMHSQTQAFQVYFLQYDTPEGKKQLNRDLDFTKSHHFVLGWDWRLASKLRLKTEAYYQALYNVPVTATPSSYSLINGGVGFDMVRPDTALVNEGTGSNFGFELTLEKFYSKGYFFLLTGSVFESTYKGSDGISRDTDFNTNFGANLLGGKEFRLGKKQKTILSFAPRFSFSGGRRYTPIDEVASLQEGDAVYVDSLAYTKQFKNYFRFDLRTSLRLNGKKVSHEIALDLVNVLNTRNELSIVYNSQANAIRKVPQLGFTPIFYYRIEF